MAGVYAELGEELVRIERELAEIDALLEQVRSEAERHEGRRKQFAARVQAIESDRTAIAADLAEPHGQLVTMTKRAALMEGQIEVLEGKRKMLARFQGLVSAVAPRVREAEAFAGIGGNGVQTAREALTAQEDMRREIARQMHDGPAQSIANIALQANIAQRLLESDPERARHELEQLARAAERALQATKSFIFDVRPMVLDDLGLVPTLRRATLERGRRASIPIHFESVGVDRRLSADLESALFRIADHAVAGFIESGAGEIAVRVSWTVEEIRLTVRLGTNDRIGAAEQRIVSEAAQARDSGTPPVLARLMREQSVQRPGTASEREIGRSMSETVTTELLTWGAAAGLDVVISPDRRAVEAVVRMGR